MHKAWCSIEEVPYYFSRSSMNFQGHTGWKIDDLMIYGMENLIPSVFVRRFRCHSHRSRPRSYSLKICLSPMTDKSCGLLYLGIWPGKRRYIVTNHWDFRMKFWRFITFVFIIPILSSSLLLSLVVIAALLLSSSTNLFTQFPWLLTDVNYREIV